MSLEGVEDAMRLGDLDELVRWVDRLGDARDWEALHETAIRCGSAFERTGHQLWPAAKRAYYRIALEAPGKWAAAAIQDDGGRFAWGPLTEVAASSHTWDELAPYLEPSPSAALFTHERVVRGECLDKEARAKLLIREPIVELPLSLSSWEPSYCLAEYFPDRFEDPRPPLPSMTDVVVNKAGLDVVDLDVDSALRALIETWVTGSNGSIAIASIEGSAEEAVGSLTHSQSQVVHWSEATPALALSHLAWAGSTSGAHGRRRGAALGRFGAWWALRALSGLPDDEPLSSEELGQAADELRWVLWSPNEPITGWQLHLAVEDPCEGLAWAIAASDHA